MVDVLLISFEQIAMFCTHIQTYLSNFVKKTSQTLAAIPRITQIFGLILENFASTQKILHERESWCL